MNWNFINTILLSIICFFVISIFLLDISVNISWKASITDWLSVGIYFVTFLAALWAARTAQKALTENKRMADDNRLLVKAQTEPFVDIKLEVMQESVNWIRLKITNLGLSSAFYIKCSVKDKDSYSVVHQKIIDQFFKDEFMKNGFSYLSQGDSKYTGFVNLADSAESNGFTVSDFLQIKFTVAVKFEDIGKQKHEYEFVLDTSDINGTYRIGKSFEDQMIGQMKDLNEGLKEIVQQQQKFHSEYEKNHREWTEQELKLKLLDFQKQRNIREKLGLPPEKIKKMEKKLSINQIRKQAK
ncbi:hypothetical protein [Acinetobacter variabilis]|uniref:hypothetical protein n=1 Tax=Acinetobacter variabilis TaxID=70346 RepID=UPI00254A1F98|nr:hypothetical protein [Acinetobacter variabilis]